MSSRRRNAKVERLTSRVALERNEFERIRACSSITAYGDHLEMSPAFFAPHIDGVSAQTLMQWTHEFCGTGDAYLAGVIERTKQARRAASRNNRTPFIRR